MERNPFAGVGQIVGPEAFIGRRESLRYLDERLVQPDRTENVAVVGIHRIGKSSLVEQGVMRALDRLPPERRPVAVWINLGLYETPWSFFADLGRKVVEAIEDDGRLTELVQRQVERVQKPDLPWVEGISALMRLFTLIRKAGIRVVVVLDEFDHARHLFRESTSGFQGLRELTYRTETQVGFVTMSRRTILEIELASHSISTLAPQFHELVLGPFDEPDVQAFFARLEGAGPALSETDRQQFHSHCGGHPYLLTAVGYEVVEGYRRTGTVDMQSALKAADTRLQNHHLALTQKLREDGTLGALMQILFGPQYNITREQVRHLTRLGVIHPGAEDDFVAFAPEFHAYLADVRYDMDLWPVLSRTERDLRHLIQREMAGKYGDAWLDKLAKEYAAIGKLVPQWLSKREKDRKRYGARASENLLDYSNTGELYVLIGAEWPVYEPILKGNKKQWDDKLRVLTGVRNPLAHSRVDSITDYERALAEVICQEIQDRLHAYDREQGNLGHPGEGADAQDE